MVARKKGCLKKKRGAKSCWQLFIHPLHITVSCQSKFTVINIFCFFFHFIFLFLHLLRKSASGPTLPYYSKRVISSITFRVKLNCRQRVRGYSDGSLVRVSSFTFLYLFLIFALDTISYLVL